MKTALPTLFAAAALLFAACEAKVNTTPAPSTEKNTTIITPGAEKKTETNTTTTVTPSGVNQTTTTEKK